MKFQRLDKSSSPDEHERFVMHIGREESKLLLSLLEQSRLNMPRISGTTQILGRIRQMEKAFRKILHENKSA